MKFSLKYLGPGIVVAATGIGAGDMIAAAVGGSSYGYTILWAVIIGALLKFALNEGVGRWQLETGSSIPEAWINKLPPVFKWYFLIYLILWSFIVSAALIAATGLAAHSIWPVLSVNQWGIIHTIFAAAFVLIGKYSYFEQVMKVLIALLFIIVLSSLFLIEPNLDGLLSGMVVPTIADGSVPYVMAIIGGVGGSVTLLSYGYWISERKWDGRKYMSRIRIDLGVAYFLTAIFGIAIVVIAANLEPEVAKSNKIILALANEIKEIAGIWGYRGFLIGFWGAVFTSMLGVWQGVPYLFADYISIWKDRKIPLRNLSSTINYKLYLLYLAFPPILLLFLQKPVWLIMVYSVVGALFMPFLAISLLWISNKKKWMGVNKSGILINISLAIAVILFCYLAIIQFMSLL